MSNYKRVFVPGGTYFFTVNLACKHSYALVKHIDLLRTAVAKVKKNQPFKIIAWVVMPNHIHAIWQLPTNDSNYPARWREIKKQFTKLLQLHLGSKDVSVWQARYWEHTIKSAEDLEAHLKYCYYNPVKHGFVKHVKDWPYSSFHRDVKRGLFSTQWGSSYIELTNTQFGE